jgi:hypothetical protein
MDGDQSRVWFSLDPAIGKNVRPLRLYPHQPSPSHIESKKTGERKASNGWTVCLCSYPIPFSMFCFLRVAFLHRTIQRYYSWTWRCVQPKPRQDRSLDSLLCVSLSRSANQRFACNSFVVGKNRFLLRVSIDSLATAVTTPSRQKSMATSAYTQLSL